MPNLKFLGHDPETHPKPNEYTGPTGSWKKGTVKEVDEKEAARLVKDFPRVFEVTKESPKA